MLQSYIEILRHTVGASMGKPIREVVYRTYEESTPSAVVAEGAGWIHGELKLAFEGSPNLFLGWGENEGFKDHFSLLPSKTTTFRPNTIVDIPALNAPEWQPLREQPLVAAELRGSNGTPHVLVLQFVGGAVAIGDGHGSEFGDGDQIIVHAMPDDQVLNFPEVFWRVSAG
jgi:hypothetical protein